MPEIATRSFDQMVAEQAAVAQSEALGRGLDFGVGSVLRAMAEAFATLAMFLQGQVLRVLTLTRASTSRGADLDTWMLDYDLPRTAAATARGQVTFGRFTPALPAFVPAGDQVVRVRTSDGAWSYRVLAEPAHSLWSVAQGGYVVPAGTPSLTVPVVAEAAGVGGNAAAGTVTMLTGALPGIDTVTNAAGFTGGTEAESDEAYIERFRAYLASLSRATLPAVAFAISGVQAGLTWNILEGQDPDGRERPAAFTVVVDDGSGHPPADLISRVYAAVEQVRALGVTFSVVAPLVTLANVSMSITVLPGEDRPAVVAAVARALRAFIDSVPLAQPLSYTRLAQVAYQASPAVTNVTSILLSGGTVDLASGPRRAIRAGVISVA